MLRHGLAALNLLVSDNQANPGPLRDSSKKHSHSNRNTKSPAVSDYPLHDRDALVIICGRICAQCKKINMSTSLAGQRLGLKEGDDAIWLVSFLDYDLGDIDLQQKTPQPLDNPPRPLVSPR